MAQIICENLTLGYEGEIVAKDLTFSVEAGTYLCIIGENGTGKSTLMKTILGLKSPLKGRVIFGDGLRGRDIGYLSQQTEVQRDFPASVEEIVLSGCQGRMGLRPFYNDGEKALAEGNMRRLGILELKNRCYRDLSGGQQQRVLLARALTAARRALFLDEPASGLDPEVTEDMYRIIREINKDGVTIVMITHDLSEAVPAATHILRLGRRNFWGTQKEYRATAPKYRKSEGRE